MFQKVDEKELYKLIDDTTKIKEKKEKEITELKTGIAQEAVVAEKAALPITKLLTDLMTTDIDIKDTRTNKVIGKQNIKLLDTIRSNLLDQGVKQDQTNAILTNIENKSNDQNSIIKNLFDEMIRLNVNVDDMTKFLEVIMTDDPAILDDIIAPLNVLTDEKEQKKISYNMDRDTLKKIASETEEEIMAVGNDREDIIEIINMYEAGLTETDKKISSLRKGIKKEEDYIKEKKIELEEEGKLKRYYSYRKRMIIEKEKIIAELSQDLDRLEYERRNEINSLRSDLNIKTNELTELENSFNDLESSLADINEKINLIDDEITTLQNREERFFELKSKAKKKIEAKKIGTEEIEQILPGDKKSISMTTQYIDNKRVDKLKLGNRTVFITNFNHDPSLKTLVSAINSNIDNYERSDERGESEEKREEYIKRIDRLFKIIVENSEETGQPLLKLLKDLLPDEMQRGKGINKNVISGYGQRKKHPYKIIDNRFGNLEIDENKLKSFNRLKIKQGGKIILDKNVSNDLVDLFTKRFDSRKNYNLDDLITFKEVINMSGIPVNRMSEKYKISQLDTTGGNVVDIKIFESPKEMILRLGGITAAIKAGNNSYLIRNEMRQIIDKLLEMNIIKHQEHKIMTNDYKL